MAFWINIYVCQLCPMMTICVVNQLKNDSYCQALYLLCDVTFLKTCLSHYRINECDLAHYLGQLLYELCAFFGLLWATFEITYFTSNLHESCHALQLFKAIAKVIAKYYKICLFSGTRNENTFQNQEQTTLKSRIVV